MGDGMGSRSYDRPNGYTPLINFPNAAMYETLICDKCAAIVYWPLAELHDAWHDRVVLRAASMVRKKDA